MKRWMWLALAAVVVIGTAVTLVAVPDAQEWTTSSPEALAEFEKAMDARMKLYYDEMNQHIAKAYELDPDFAMAKLWSVDRVYGKDKEMAEARWDEVLAMDTSGLTGREQFFVERSRAMREERREDIPALVDEYLAKYPNDPFLINEKAVQYWSRGEYEKAEPLYRHLADVAPNWVIAYNQLGYLNMSEGRFAEAEEYFKSYRFIAPDQANPYDSLGELFVALGRYDEAEESFEKAIEVKPDFWAAYEHIALMKNFNGDFDGAREIKERAVSAEGPEWLVRDLGCLEQFMVLHAAGAWGDVLELADSECVKGPEPNFETVTLHLAASELGEWETAKNIEVEAEGLLAKIEQEGSPKNLELLRAAIDHMQGVRLALSGDYGDAKEKLTAADSRLTYIEASSAIFKLYNQTILAELLLANGKDAEAHALLSKVRGVNPVWVAEFEEAGFKALGLERG